MRKNNYVGTGQDELTNVIVWSRFMEGIGEETKEHFLYITFYFIYYTGYIGYWVNSVIFYSH